MAMGKRKKHEQPILFIPTAKLPQSAAHPFYAKLNEVLAAWKFDEFVEGLCAKFYEEKIGRPSLAPGKYFRLLLIGYFEGIDSERGIAWRCSDSLSLRAFVGYRLDEISTEHSTISRTRRLIDLETHREVFQWVLKVLADYDLISGKTVGIDATTLEANAAMMLDLAEMNIRSYVAEPDRGRRDWTDKPQERDAVYANRRRIRGARGKRLMKKRGELIERSLAHNYETGAMRRTHLRRHENIAKRLLVHVGGFNLSLVMRKLTGFGKPRRLQGRSASIFDLILAIWNAVATFPACWTAAMTQEPVWPTIHWAA
jgi:transposase